MGEAVGVSGCTTGDSPAGGELSGSADGGTYSLLP